LRNWVCFAFLCLLGWNLELVEIGFVLQASAESDILLIRYYNSTCAYLSIEQIGFVLHNTQTG